MSSGPATPAPVVPPPAPPSGTTPATGPTNPTRGSFMEAREPTTAFSVITDWVYWLIVFGNARRESLEIVNPSQVPPPPPTPPPTPSMPTPVPPSPAAPSPALINVDEGITYFTDPWTMMFSYLPFWGGIITLAVVSPLHLAAAMPGLIGGASAIVFGAAWFVFFTEMLPPLTLGIRQFAGKIFLRECRVTTFRLKWLRDFLGITFVKIPAFRGIRLESDQSDPANQLKSHMHMTGNPAKGIPDSQVEVAFDGVIVFAIDIDRPLTVTAMFWDDYIANPPQDGMSLADDMELRSRRTIQPLVYAACDPTLQTIEWREAARNIGYVNNRLISELPDRLGILAIEVQSIQLSEAYGRPFDELRRETDARLKADADVNVAESERDARQAQATAASVATRTEVEQEKLAEVARAESERAIGIAQQEKEMRVAEQRLLALAQLTQVAEREAQITVAPLIARLGAINTQQSAAVIDSLTALDATQRLAVWQQLMTSLGTAPVPDTLVSVANAGGLDSFQAPALIDALNRILGGFQRALPSASPPAAPAPATPPTTP